MKNDDIKLFDVLILDDEQFVCENIRLKLKRLSHEGVQYNTTLCNTASQAMNMIRETCFDIILTDIKMPFINGLSFIQTVRSELAFKGKIFVVSGHDNFDYVRTAFINGADDYLLKPISISELNEKLLKAINLHDQDITTNRDITAIATFENIVDYAIEYMQENYTDPDLNMNDVATHISVSYNHFSNLFHKETNTSFPSFLKKIRVEKAIELLKDPSMKISDICYKVGFKYPQQFSRDFKIVTGLYPTQYRSSPNVVPSSFELDQH